MRKCCILFFDSYKILQRPVQAALREPNEKHRTQLMSAVVNCCVFRNNMNSMGGIGGGRMRPLVEQCAYVTATLSHLRHQGASLHGLEVLRIVKENFPQLKLRDQWFDICLGAIVAFSRLPSSSFPFHLLADHKAVLEEKKRQFGILCSLFPQIPATHMRSSASLGILLQKGCTEKEQLALKEMQGEHSSTVPLLLFPRNSPRTVGGLLSVLSDTADVDGDFISSKGADAAQQNKLLEEVRTAMVSSSGSSGTLVPMSYQRMITSNGYVSLFGKYSMIQGIVCNEEERLKLVQAVLGDTLLATSQYRKGAATPPIRDIVLRINVLQDTMTSSSSFLLSSSSSLTSDNVDGTLSSSLGLHNVIKELFSFTPHLKPVPWYPNSLAWRMDSKTMISEHKQAVSVRYLIRALSEQGLVSFQSASSMLPALLLAQEIAAFAKMAKILQKEDEGRGLGRDNRKLRLLDVCAAPGGKTMELLDLLDSMGSSEFFKDTLVVANDPDRMRLNLMRQRFGGRSRRVVFTSFLGDEMPMSVEGAGVGVNNVHTRSNNMMNTAEPFIGQSSFINLNNNDNVVGSVLYDGVLLDVPCTGDGRLLRSRDLSNECTMKTWHPKECLSFHIVQLELLKRAIALTRIGGCIVYSTCSLNPLENEAVVSYAISEGLVEVVSVRSSGEAKGKGDGEVSHIPEELAGYARRGVTTWNVPVDNQGHYVKGTKEQMQTYEELLPSMLPPKSVKVQGQLRKCLRMLPFSSTNASDEIPLRLIDGFFIAKLIVKRHSEGKIFISQDNNNMNCINSSLPTMNQNDVNSNNYYRNKDSAFLFKNVDRFFSFLPSNLTKNPFTHQLLSTLSSTVLDTTNTRYKDNAFFLNSLMVVNAAESCVICDLCAQFGISANSFLEYFKKGCSSLLTRPVKRSEDDGKVIHRAVVKTFEVSNSVENFLFLPWVSPRKDEYNGTPINKRKTTLNATRIFIKKKTPQIENQAALNPGKCLWYYMVVMKRGLQHGSERIAATQHNPLTVPVVIPSMEGAAVLSNLATKQVLNVPLELLMMFLSSMISVPKWCRSSAELQSFTANFTLMKEALGPRTFGSSITLISGATATGFDSGNDGLSSLLCRGIFVDEKFFTDPFWHMKSYGKRLSQDDPAHRRALHKRHAAWVEEVIGAKSKITSGALLLECDLYEPFKKTREGDSNTIYRKDKAYYRRQQQLNDMSTENNAKCITINLPAIVYVDNTYRTSNDGGYKRAFLELVCDEPTVNKLKVLLPKYVNAISLALSSSSEGVRETGGINSLTSHHEISTLDMEKYTSLDEGLQGKGLPERRRLREIEITVKRLAAAKDHARRLGVVVDSSNKEGGLGMELGDEEKKDNDNIEWGEGKTKSEMENKVVNELSEEEVCY